MELLSQYSLFLLKTITMVVAFIIVLASFFALSRKPKPKIDIISLNEQHDRLMVNLNKEIFNKKTAKKKKSPSLKPILYVLDFIGDIKASQVEQLKEEITALLAIAKPEDEVLIRLESPGGSVNGYGLAASQLQRIRDRNIPLTVCIDKIAASGGYLMACVAHQILAAPFAIIGSIGVVAQIPNIHRLLKKKDIDVELLTAGEYKRTLTILGENTEAGRKKFQEDLEKIHVAFKNYVLANRKALDIDKVSTGEHWLATDALTLHLVDKITTSDDYLIEKMNQFKAFKLTIQPKASLINKLLRPAMQWLHPWA